MTDYFHWFLCIDELKLICPEECRRHLEDVQVRKILSHASAFTNAKRNDELLEILGSTIIPTLRIVDFVVAAPNLWIVMKCMYIDEGFCLEQSRSQHGYEVNERAM